MRVSAAGPPSRAANMISSRSSMAAWTRAAGVMGLAPQEEWLGKRQEVILAKLSSPPHPLSRTGGDNFPYRVGYLGASRVLVNSWTWLSERPALVIWPQHDLFCKTYMVRVAVRRNNRRLWRKGVSVCSSEWS